MDFPDVIFEVDDDETAIRILAHEGLLGEFSGYTGAAKAYVAVIKHVDHPTHWLVAVCFGGETENPADNGYRIYGFPKTQYSIDYIDDFIVALQKRHDGGYDDLKTDFPEPDRN
jgi:hypothetical protein